MQASGLKGGNGKFFFQRNFVIVFSIEGHRLKFFHCHKEHESNTSCFAGFLRQISVANSDG